MHLGDNIFNTYYLNMIKDYIEKHAEYSDWGKVLIDRPNNKWLKIDYHYLEK